MLERTKLPVPQTPESFRCSLCRRSYSARSSFVRHSKLCGVERNTGLPRQKSCRQCSKAKTRCDQQQPICSRCSSRGDFCEYVSNPYQDHDHGTGQTSELPCDFVVPDGPIREIDLEEDETNPQDIDTSIQIGPTTLFSTRSCIADYSPTDDQLVSGEEPGKVGSNFSRPVEPTCFTAAVPISDNVSVEAIRDRWLYPYVEDSPAKFAMLEHSMQFLCRVLRTYPRMMARQERVPPVIHPMQVTAENITLPLANCFTLVKMWESNGQTASELIEQTIKREMQKLFEEYRTYSPPALVAAFQALLIYSIILLFPTPQKPSPGSFNQIILVSLQDVGYYVIESGLVLSAETEHARPTWDSWILVNAKRRTLMALYCFEWMYAKLNALPTYPCTELGFAPAPAGKVLWEARSQEEWEGSYDRWLERWNKGGFYSLKELELVKPGPEIDARTEMWLEEADEFGMMNMSLVNAAEGHLAIGNARGG